MSSAKNYLSMVKFSHTVFAMPFALSGFFLAYYLTDTPFSWRLLALVLFCMVFARNAAMSFNRVVDRFIDKRNPRTAIREIPAGKVTPRSAMLFTILNSVLFVVAAYHINLLTFLLSPVALLVILGYSYTKRFTVLCHLVLGLGLALAPLGAYLSVTGHFHVIPVLYSILVLFWVSGFDIIYSLQDEEFDKDEMLRSIPAYFGRLKSLWIANFLHLVSVAALVLIGFAQASGLFYWIGASAFIALLIYQHLIVTPKDISRVNVAFGTLNGIASIIFMVFNIISFYY
ncbi:MAG: UbiA family prenyltransferase [Bacteroidales bacterium]|nr:UbiA family prenyltransferase [Bacteroidales bacterium]MBN2749241.1 UbiA family prenyltransferase [Bacteroidales bacterium]